MLFCLTRFLKEPRTSSQKSFILTRHEIGTFAGQISHTPHSRRVYKQSLVARGIRLMAAVRKLAFRSQNFQFRILLHRRNSVEHQQRIALCIMSFAATAVLTSSVLVLLKKPHSVMLRNWYAQNISCLLLHYEAWCAASELHGDYSSFEAKETVYCRAALVQSVEFAST